MPNFYHIGQKMWVVGQLREICLQSSVIYELFYLKTTAHPHYKQTVQPTNIYLLRPRGVCFNQLRFNTTFTAIWSPSYSQN